LIVCDAALLNEFLSARDLDKEAFRVESETPTGTPFAIRPLSHEALKLRRRQLVLWIIGHELGHWRLNHDARHFGPSPLDQKLLITSVRQSQELEADAFAIGLLSKPYAEDAEFYSFIYAFLFNEARMKLCPDVSPLQPCDGLGFGVGLPLPVREIVVSTEQTHPEYVVRALRLMYQADNLLGYGNGVVMSEIDKLIDRWIVDHK
jgi:hypothetical protein